MSTKTSIIVFGDQTEESWLQFKDLSRRSRHSPAAQKFLESASDALRNELSKCSQYDRTSFNHFYSFADLADKHARGGILDTAVETVLHCVTQLGSLIICMENNLASLDSGSTKSIYLGSCTGLIIAATAATIPSIQELLQIGPEIICFSLRVGLEARRRSMQIESSSDSWATAVLSLPEEEICLKLNEFNSSHTLPRSHIAYISAISHDSCTISGPPSTIERLFSVSSKLLLARKIKLPISAAFHASHLAPASYRNFIGPTSILKNFWIKKSSRLYSSSTGKVWLGHNLSDILERVVHDILYKPLQWTKTIQSVIRQIDTENVELQVIGSGNAAKSLKVALETNGFNVTFVACGQTQRLGSQDIAITGMSGRFPGANNLHDFWKILVSGREMHRKIPADRFDVSSHYDPSGLIKNTSLTPYGCFIENPGFFDTRLFNMSPREASQTDPAQRLLLLTTYEALEMAGYSNHGGTSIHSNRVGTFFGQTTDDWREHNASQNIDIYYVTGGIRAFGPGRLNYHFKWDGPSYSFDTACSSSSVAIQMARSALLSRECDMAVAGGANILTGSDMFAGLSRGGFLSPTGSCKTFSNLADGYCRADGAGSIIMKRLDDAIADGDNIQAILRSARTNHSANAKSITHPHTRTQEDLFRQVLREAAIDAEEIDYVEMHGTGTQAGDSTEYSSVSNEIVHGRSRARPLYIGAVKPNVGHSEAAAGITSVIKAILMMRQNIIPPHVSVKDRASDELQASSANQIQIPQSQLPFESRKSPATTRKVLVNNFSAAGGNTSLLFEEPPSRILEGKDPRSPHIVIVSAKTKNSLLGNLARLRKYLETYPETNIADLAYTTSARRMHHIYRQAFLVETVVEIKERLAKAIANIGEIPLLPRDSFGRIAFVFPGQGSQYTCMGAQLFEFCTSFQEKALECEQLCLNFGFPSFITYIKGGSSSDGSAFSPIQTQLGLVSLEISLATLWQSWGVCPSVVIGHSLGEYAALHIAGAISLASTLYLVGKRAELMQKHCTLNSHSMIAVQETAQRMHLHIRDSGAEGCEISCINGPQSIVVSAATEQMNILEDFLCSISVKSRRINVPFAFHSSQMDPLLDEFEMIAGGVHFSRPRITFASTAEGCVVENGWTPSARYLRQQTRSPVLMFDALSACSKWGLIGEASLCLECGPGSTCINMIKGALGTLDLCSLSSLDQHGNTWNTVSKSIAKAYERGLDIFWLDFHRDYRYCLRLLELPTYSFDLENHWIQYEGTWSISKGDVPRVENNPVFLTACVQRLISKKIEDNRLLAIFESTLADPGLKSLISGHRVHGFDLCPASVYTEMAFGAACYVHHTGRHFNVEDAPGMELRNLEISKPLILSPGSASQKVQIICAQELNSSMVRVEIKSQDGSEVAHHARCAVSFENTDAWKTDWARYMHFISDAQDQLIKSVNMNKSHKLLRSLVYKVFGSIVDYDTKYQSLQEVFMKDGLYEATATIKLQETSIDQNCIHNPYWIDCLAQLGGFVLNGGSATSPDMVYLANGWEALRLSGRLSPRKQYSCHVRMMQSDLATAMVGDVYLLNQDAVIAACYGLIFKPVKKNVLHSLFSTIVGHNKSHNEDNLPAIRQEVELHHDVPSTSLDLSSANLSCTMTPSSSQTDGHISDRIALIIAAEIGVNRNDIAQDTSLTALGLDSLLSISILARVRKETGLMLPSSFFNDHPKMEDVRRALDMHDKDLTSPNLASCPAPALPKVLATLPKPKKGASRISENAPGYIETLACSTVCLQGTLSTGPALFLLPDGAGSAQSYAELPQLSPTVSVYGIDSPFFTCPQDYCISFEETASCFVRAIRSVQPQGPYILGGWSLGGIHAYAVSRQLISSGETVKNLIMIDSPCPGILPPLPAPTLTVLDKAGVFDGLRTMGKGIPEATKTHFLRSVAALEKWSPGPLSSLSGGPQQVDIVWGKSGVLEAMTEKQRKLCNKNWEKTGAAAVEARDWLFGDRKGYGAEGWDRLIGTGNVRCHVVEGNHFSMMKAPQVTAVGAIISEVLTT